MNEMENKKSKKDRVFFAIYGGFFIGILLEVLILSLMLPDRTFSEKERRSLTTFPAVSLSSVLDGSFETGIEDYSADQFPLRDRLMTLKTSFCNVLGMKESNGVYYGKDGFLMERFDTPDGELLSHTAVAVSDFSARHESSNVYFMLAPTAVSLYPEMLPKNASNADQDAYISNFYESLSEEVRPVDVREALEEAKAAGTRLYYHSDHHWTTDGAKAAYEAAIEVMDLKESDYRRAIISNDFLGALSAKSGFSIPEKDCIVAYLPEDETLKYIVRNDESGETRASVYHGEALSGPDPYLVFFGGNYPSLTIETTAKNDRSLLIIKDSYANSFMPFMLENYRKITVIDPRYYSRQVDMLFYLEEYDDVLFLYNASTLAKDKNLYKVLETR